MHVRGDRAGFQQAIGQPESAGVGDLPRSSAPITPSHILLLRDQFWFCSRLLVSAPRWRTSASKAAAGRCGSGSGPSASAALVGSDPKTWRKPEPGDERGPDSRQTSGAQQAAAALRNQGAIMADLREGTQMFGD